MGLKSSFMIATRSLWRRKTKNLSAILAVTLGVTLLVGIQITTDTLENAFLTSLLQREGEVDFRITNSTTGGCLTAADAETIHALVPDAVGIMPELAMRVPVMLGSQFDDSVKLAGIPLNFPEAFGSFYDWKTGEEIDIGDYLTDNSTVLMSSRLAKKLGLTQDDSLPVALSTEFTNVTVTVIINPITGLPVSTPRYSTERFELSVVGIFDSNRPGIGSQHRGLVLALEHLQEWRSLQDPTRETDCVDAYLVALKTDHFTSEINEDYLRGKVDTVKANIPEKVDPATGNPQKIYSVTSARLTFFSVAAIIMTLLTTILTALGLLIMITGILLITNVQLMNIEDREFQTGVLRAVGENRRGIFQSLLIENMFQGILGGILGLIGGLAFGQAVALYLVGLFGTGELSVQPIVSPQVVILSVIIGVALGIITGILPALRASRVNIVEALRGIKVSFEEKSGRNLVLLGILAVIAGVLVLLINGVFDESHQAIWVSEGWNTLGEWRNILVGAGLLFSGLGVVLSRFISRVKALNITAIAIWAMPVVLFVVAMGEWIPDITGLAPDILIIGVMEIVVGSVLLVSVNLPIVMNALRSLLVKIRGLKGVGQIAPALISSHKARSTLTFAIFAVILTLNVTVATLVPTSLTPVIETERDSRGIDIIVFLNKPEAQLVNTSYAAELYKLDSQITDVIAFKTYKPTTDYMKFVAVNNPYSREFNVQRDLLPLGYAEITSEQLRGNASDASDPDWRYDFYLSSFPDDIPQPAESEVTDEQLLEMSKQAWDLFFDPSYKMAAYNISLSALLSEDRDLRDIDLSNLGGYTSKEREGIDVLRYENGSIIENPVVFTDSFILPSGLQIWVPMNTSQYGLPTYQAFTVAGRLDAQRAGGFPLSSFNIMSQEGDFDYVDLIGRIYLPEHWANQTSFLAEADGKTSISRAPDQYDYFLIKTTYDMDDPQLESIAQAIMEFTNTNDEDYRLLAGDNFYVASATVLYSKIERSLEMVNRVVSFLQIYVTFGLAIGAVGMAVISVRNVSERKREIGMMRAIGFPRTQVMLSVLLELVVLGIIGLAIGVVNGVLISVGFANMQGATLVIPWNDLGIYLGFITLIALAAGAIPGWFASRIPPAEALRYVG
ncbi:MAG TPA: FtsX-like permease family protein [Candidatus Bathyarchaeota archaeon]|nr:FtsX-like permease family protein [Candidatus Bathyarchaeota archaeon]